ncbi:hypothetical protein ACFL3S_10170, partial [Gemmatimonadota bacterium]
GYRVLRFLLRGAPTRFAFRWLHPDLGAWIARRVSQTHRRTDEPTERLVGRARFLEEWAGKQLRAAPDLDMVVLGHSHLPVVKEVEPGRFYLNAGDWIRHRTFAVLETGIPPRVLEWG